MTNEKPNKENGSKQEREDREKTVNNTEEEKGGFGEKGNGKPEPTRYNDWEVDGRCSDF